MLRTFGAGNRLRDAVETSLNGLCRTLEARHFATVEADRLQPDEGALNRLGSKPLLRFHDAEGHRYVIKLAEPDLREAEVAAYELRKLGRRPGLAARVVELELADVGRVEGLLKPYLEFDGSLELGTDTTAWTPLQRAVLLQEHAWEWFLDNLDTNTSQYALLGTDAVPVNLDWDRSFSSEARSELSRFAKYRATLPNARTFLYDDYVQGRIELPFSLLVHEARRIRRLPAQQVRKILEPYASAHFADLQAREEFLLRVLSRKHRIEREAQRFVRALVEERRSLTGPSPTLRASARNHAVVLWGRWQVVLNTVLRGPVGNACRSVLTVVRGRRHLPAAPKPTGTEAEAPAGQ